MDGDDRRQPRAHVADGREELRQLLPVRVATEPTDRPRPRVRPLEPLEHVGDAVPVHHRRHLDGRAGALPVEARRGGQHAGRQRQMTPRRGARQHQPARVQVVVVRVLDDPAHRAQAVLHRGRRVRRPRQAVLDVHDRPPHLQVGQQREEARLLAAEDMRPAVKVDERRMRPRRVVARHVDVQLPFPLVGRQVGHVGDRPELLTRVDGPPGGFRQLPVGDSGREHQNGKRRDETTDVLRSHGVSSPSLQPRRRPASRRPGLGRLYSPPGAPAQAGRRLFAQHRVREALDPSTADTRPVVPLYRRMRLRLTGQLLRTGGWPAGIVPRPSRPVRARSGSEGSSSSARRCRSTSPAARLSRP